MDFPFRGVDEMCKFHHGTCCRSRLPPQSRDEEVPFIRWPTAPVAKLGSGNVKVPTRTLFGALAVVACLTGCAVVFEGNFSFPETPCRTLLDWCVVEVPSVGYLAYGAGNSGRLDHTMISFRLAPHEGVTAAWSSEEVTLVDVDTNKSMRFKALDTKPVTGRQIVPSTEEDLWVLYGPYTPGEFRLEPRIAKMEVQVPPILRDGQMIRVDPVRINDGPRTPKVIFLLPQ
jgi:hypothetical protein